MTPCTWSGPDTTGSSMKSVSPAATLRVARITRPLPSSTPTRQGKHPVAGR